MYIKIEQKHNNIFGSFNRYLKNFYTKLEPSSLKSLNKVRRVTPYIPNEILFSKETWGQLRRAGFLLLASDKFLDLSSTLASPSSLTQTLISSTIPDNIGLLKLTRIISWIHDRARQDTVFKNQLSSDALKTSLPNLNQGQGSLPIQYQADQNISSDQDSDQMLSEQNPPDKEFNHQPNINQDYDLHFAQTFLLEPDRKVLKDSSKEFLQELSDLSSLDTEALSDMDQTTIALQVPIEFLKIQIKDWQQLPKDQILDIINLLQFAAMSQEKPTNILYSQFPLYLETLDKLHSELLKTVFQPYQILKIIQSKKQTPYASLYSSQVYKELYFQAIKKIESPVNDDEAFWSVIIAKVIWRILVAMHSNTTPVPIYKSEMVYLLIVLYAKIRTQQHPYFDGNLNQIVQKLAGQNFTEMNTLWYRIMYNCANSLRICQILPFLLWQHGFDLKQQLKLMESDDFFNTIDYKLGVLAQLPQQNLRDLTRQGSISTSRQWEGYELLSRNFNKKETVLSQ